MADINIGVNLIEILTTGMYKDARTIFREYIQNSCDAIDAAGGGSISIIIDADDGYICIEDDGTGIDALKFENTLKNIANSGKTSAGNKGFRGIGRLCGLAYCKQLKFTSFSKGTACWMTFDAEKLRSNFYKGLNLSANQILNEITKTDSDPVNQNMSGFKVELFGVKNPILLNEEKIIAYLSFVAPVPYSADFTFADKIHAHAENLGCKIDEYEIILNNKQIFKSYENTMSTRGYRDELFDVSFRDFYDDENNLLAWCWIGLTGFRGQINSNIPARALRLRKGNIQIGDESALQEFFKEIRGTYYFVGEVFAVHSQLIPNSQRDYFVPHDTRKTFEENLRDYFLELHKIYHGASDINSAKKKIRDYKDAQDAFPVDGNNKNIFKLQFKLIEAGYKAKQAHCDIKHEMVKACENPNDDLSRVVFYLTQDVDEITIPKIRISAPPPVYQQHTWRNLLAG